MTKGPEKVADDAELGQASAAEDVEGVKLDLDVGEGTFAEGEDLGKVGEADGQHVR